MARLGSRPITFGVRGPIERDDLPGLCDRVCTLLSANVGQLVDCDVDGVPSDAMTVEALARLQLAAQRTGCRIRLRNASADLVDLVDLMGLTDVLPS
jgi:ABC-type transporter Mla MlaB component